MHALSHQHARWDLSITLTYSKTVFIVDFLYFCCVIARFLKGSCKNYTKNSLSKPILFRVHFLTFNLDVRAFCYSSRPSRFKKKKIKWISTDKGFLCEESNNVAQSGQGSLVFLLLFFSTRYQRSLRCIYESKSFQVLF